jgi:8-oxo-dGTP diphosphatase
MNIKLVVCVALIDEDGRVLIAQRPEGEMVLGVLGVSRWEVEMNESPETALIRELHEELGINTWGSCLAPLTFASHKYDEFHLLMPLYVCRKWSGIVQARENQALKWLTPAQILKVKMLPADLPLVACLRDLLS